MSLRRRARVLRRDDVGSSLSRVRGVEQISRLDQAVHYSLRLAPATAHLAIHPLPLGCYLRSTMVLSCEGQEEQGQT